MDELPIHLFQKTYEYLSLGDVCQQRVINKKQKSVVEYYAIRNMYGARGMHTFRSAAKMYTGVYYKDPWKIYLVVNYHFRECIFCGNLLHYSKSCRCDNW